MTESCTAIPYWLKAFLRGNTKTRWEEGVTGWL
jgi:hypothetical protein